MAKSPGIPQPGESTPPGGVQFSHDVGDHEEPVSPEGAHPGPSEEPTRGGWGWRRLLMWPASLTAAPRRDEADSEDAPEDGRAPEAMLPAHGADQVEADIEAYIEAGPDVDPDTEPAGDPDDDLAEDPDAVVGPGVGQAEPGEPGPTASPDDLSRLLRGLTGLEPENHGPGAAAFFDVDNTTIRGSSFVALAKGMADRDYFTTAEILSITWKQLKYVVSGTENMDDITAATENGLEFVKGREVTEIQTLSDEVYDEKMVDRLWSGTLALTGAHLAAGHQVWLVSATPREVAEVIATRLGLTGGLGTVAEVVDGRYTGKLHGLPLHGQAKADVIRELAASHGLDLARCSAYSDSANDIPMLSVVGHPVAINPDGKLRAHARAQGWPIRDYRIRGRESVRRGVPAAAAAGLIAGVAVGVAKAVAAVRDR